MSMYLSVTFLHITGTNMSLHYGVGVLRIYNGKSYNQRNMHIEGFWDVLMRLWANGSCHFEGSSSRPSNPKEMTFTQ
jgi:hypothetical protein